MGFLRHLTACNTHDLSRYRPFLVAGQHVGHVREDFFRRLLALGDPFEPTGDGIALAERSGTAAGRTAAMAAALDVLVADGTLPGLRRETYPVLTRWGAEPLLGIDRAAVPFFGLRSFGLHVNGYVRRPDGLHLWVGHRARDRGVAPGKLDNLVAGGQPMGLTLAENLRKEAHEEAGLPAAVADRARPVGVISYLLENGSGLKPDTLFCYDLELPDGLVPRNTDGEVERFELWPLHRVAESVAGSDDWKFNVNLVVIDFLIRHGWLTPDHPDYIALCSGLRR
ncbi:DUF4743 domain-containing protein [Rhodocista pekingensis]|uniref:DUF4743 domain-containing protein n=1 Tax=Rhodocista pekingensis TaxID=201185 RepID=A0ABW2KUW7_9PROT